MQLMKTYIYIIASLFTFVSCKAQIVNVRDFAGNVSEGLYVRDTDNLLNDFTGTYLFTNGSTSLKIVFQKKVANPTRYDNHNFTEDLLIGEYQYIENGIEKSNTLMNLGINMLDANSHSISGNTILQGNVFNCEDCGPDEIRLQIGVYDGYAGATAQMTLRKKIVSGQPALEVIVIWSLRFAKTDETLLPVAFPGGQYIMLKQQ